ncbi:hypothetical protein QFA96_12270 [Pseudomonas sp. Ap32]|nr:hypothetical protein QFA96_12270 [Pseudomonas sp. Ap32]
MLHRFTDPAFYFIRDHLFDGGADTVAFHRGRCRGLLSIHLALQ